MNTLGTSWVRNRLTQVSISHVGMQSRTEDLCIVLLMRHPLQNASTQTTKLSITSCNDLSLQSSSCHHILIPHTYIYTIMYKASMLSYKADIRYFNFWRLMLKYSFECKVWRILLILNIIYCIYWLVNNADQAFLYPFIYIHKWKCLLIKYNYL